MSADDQARPVLVSALSGCNRFDLARGLDNCIRVLARIVASLLLATALGIASPSLDVHATTTRPAAEPYLGFPTTSPLVTPGDWTTADAFPGLTFDDPISMTPEPGSNRLWVTEREGRIFAFENRKDVDDKTLVLDISSHTQGNSDAGLLSMAFHPEFAAPGSPNFGAFYVAYAHTDDDPIVDERPSSNTKTRFRLSRFVVPIDTSAIDPASEQILIEQDDNSLWHMGGAMFFHPDDGFLYLAVGDEGGGSCSHDNCQRINKDLFAGVLRIDVDRRGNDISHPIVNQPKTGMTADYYIPTDNPFVGVPGALEEFYAIGLRSPHRMTHDPVDGLTWIADVGQAKREEIDLLARGANYQWAIREGGIPYKDSDGLPPNPLIGVWTEPFLELERSVGATVIGGYVYRGDQHIDLYGKYVYGDYVKGTISALTYETTNAGAQVTEQETLQATSFRGRSDGITSFATDTHGDLYLLTLGDASKIRKLVIEDQEPGDIPTTLSETGLFTSFEPLTANSSLVPYGVNTPLWSDGAIKTRWLAVPSNETIAFLESAPWQLPAGSVFVKHFELPTDESDPSVLRRLETRVLVVQADGAVYGVTYKWREDQSDADLLVSAFCEDIPIVQSDGSVRSQHYRYPSPTDCLTCHTSESGWLLGTKARQLKGLPVGSTPDADPQQGQLRWLSHAGFFDTPPSQATLDSIEALSPLDDEDASLEKRVRSYLDANCAHCHGAVELERSVWDARYTRPLVEQGIVWGELLGDYEGDDNRVVTPGDLERSILYRRVMTVELDLRMPPLARSEQDTDFLDVLERWIAGLEGTTTSTTLPPRICGNPVVPGGPITTTDALFVLQASVGGQSCDLCICDVDNNGGVAASDALRVLRHAVDIGIVLTCPACM